MKKTNLLKMIAVMSIFSIRAMAQGEPLFEDNFDNNYKSWSLVENDDRTTKITGGILFIQNKNDKGYWTGQPVTKTSYASTNYSLKVKTQHTGGVDDHGYGLVFGTKDVNNGYQFFITQNKYFRVSKYEDGTMTNICEWTKSDVIYGYLSNNLEVKKLVATGSFTSMVQRFTQPMPVPQWVAMWVFGFTTNKPLSLMIFL
ncbi:MAG: hypothetical protein NTX03_12765 [Bacteroidetes bacterium]|nr:hypothetical protein [Bacteroidota bacterium]